MWSQPSLPTRELHILATQFSADGKYIAWQSMARDGYESDRNRATASLYDQLGLACYEAMEAFVEYKPL